MDEPELKPCPFCGGEASANGYVKYGKPLKDVFWEGGLPITEAFFCNCIACGVTNIIGQVGHQTREASIAAWNARAKRDAVDVAQLRVAVDGLLAWAANLETGIRFALAAGITELNLGNYDHDQVCDLQNEAIEIHSVLTAALERNGKPMAATDTTALIAEVFQEVNALPDGIEANTHAQFSHQTREDLICGAALMITEIAARDRAEAAAKGGAQ